MISNLPVLMSQFPSSLTRTHELASSNSKSCSSSILFANSGSFFRLRFRLRMSHSGSGRAVFAPAMVYTGTAECVESFICPVRNKFVGGKRSNNYQNRFLIEKFSGAKLGSFEAIRIPHHLTSCTPLLEFQIRVQPSFSPLQSPVVDYRRVYILSR